MIPNFSINEVIGSEQPRNMIPHFSINEVIGSEKPWIEACLLSVGVDRIVTMEYLATEWQLTNL
jgi:hypothetical protein